MDGYIKTMRAKIGHERLVFVGAAVLPVRGRQVLLQRRSDNGLWAGHGGCVEVGEVVEDAARRELLEETGLVAGRLTLLDVFSGEPHLYTYPNGDEVYVVCVAYVCRDFEGEPTVDGNEVSQLQWFDLDALPQDVFPPDCAMLAKLAQLWRDGGLD